MRRGELKPATAFACVDCGKPAQCYGHRDYSKPLDVEPVCKARPDAYISKRVRRMLEARVLV